MFKNLPAIRTTFKVYERLKREQHIDTLFRKGKAFSVFPIRVIYLAVNESVAQGAESEASMSVDVSVRSERPAELKVGFSVPKKKFKRSVDRHRIRRLMVETWRHNKAALLQTLPPDKGMHVFLVYTGTELPTYEAVHAAVSKSIDKLKSIITS